MLIFHKPPLVLFSMPRTGSTALQMALSRRSDIALRHPAKIKHMNVKTFERVIAPELPNGGRSYQRVAILRDPLDRLHSWYKYRKRPELIGNIKSTAHLTFDQFLDGVLSPRQPPWGDIGDQYGFVTNAQEEMGVHHLFCVERPAIYQRFLRAHLGPSTFERLNVSPPEKLEASRKMINRLKVEREKEYLLLSTLRRVGHLQPDL